MTGAREGQMRGARTERSRVMTGGISMLGQIQVTPRCADDTLRRHVGSGSVGEGGGCLPLEVNQGSVRDGGTGQVNKYVTISDRA